jgi:hypothetical protein
MSISASRRRWHRTCSTGGDAAWRYQVGRKSGRKPLSRQELGKQQGAELPHREAMSMIAPGGCVFPPVMTIPPGEVVHPMPIEDPAPTPQPAETA